MRTLGGNKDRMRLVSALAPLALVLVLAACSGGSTTDTSAAIPGPVAKRLAGLSDKVAAAWDAGDKCGAAQDADELRHAADDAIASGEIPAAYRDALEAAVTNLQNNANCPAPAKPSENEDKGKKKGHDKHNDEGSTITTDTTTVESD